jgi:uncharacterized FlaG/YvyC family protein
MPRNIKLKPLITRTRETVASFEQEYLKSQSSENAENDIDETYQSFVEDLHRNMEEFQDYRNFQLNEVNPKSVDDELLKEVVESIFNIEKNGNINEKSDRVRQIQNALFWDAIKDFQWQLESLEDEANHKIDDVDTDSSSKKR